VDAADLDGGPSAGLGCVELDVPGDPFGNVEALYGAAGRVVASGWLLDVDSPEPTGVHVYVDGRFAGSGVADRPRADVQAVYPLYGANRGFTLSVPAAPGPRTCACSGSTSAPVPATRCWRAARCRCR
jgi:hypothetical protein